MHVVIIENTGENFAEACRAAKAKGLRWAATSNTGLTGNLMRLTFLPASAFRDEPQGQHKDGMPITQREPRRWRDIIAELDDEQPR